MKITTNPQLLAHEVRLLNEVIATKTPLPVLSNILFSATTELILTATDMQVMMRMPCAAVIAATGEITLPGKKLLEILDQLPTTDVTIETIDNHVVITCGQFRSRIQTLPALDFPKLPGVEGESATLPSAALHSMIERTKYAISDRASQYVMKGSLLSLYDDVFAMASTDGKRLALATANRTKGAQFSAVIPLKTLDTLLSFCDGKNMEFSCSDRHLYFLSGQRLLISRKIDGQFPKYERIIPKNCDKKVTVDRGALTSTLKRIILVSDEKTNYITFNLTSKTLHLAARCLEIGDADEILTVDYEGPDFQITLNAKHVLEFLEKSAQPSITIDFINESTPLIFTDGPDFVNIIIGMRIP